MDKHPDATDCNPYCDLCGQPIVSGEPRLERRSSRVVVPPGVLGTGSVRGLSSRGRKLAGQRRRTPESERKSRQ